MSFYHIKYVIYVTTMMFVRLEIVIVDNMKGKRNKHQHYYEVGKVAVDDNGNVKVEYICSRRNGRAPGCGYCFVEDVVYPSDDDLEYL